MTPDLHLLRRRRGACAFSTLLLIGLAFLAASCGSSGTPRSLSGSSSVSGSGSTSGTTGESPSASAMQAIEGSEFARFASVAPAASARLPSAPRTGTAERAYLTALFDDAQSVWRREFASARVSYEAARGVVYSGATHSSCGRSEGSGPFYCPSDRSVYLDLQFFALLLHESGVGAAAQAYIVGHEIAHHVQRLVGIARRADAAAQADPSLNNAVSVKVELQADCLAGVWARSAYPRSGLSVADLYEALRTAHVIGDDYLTEAAGDVVDTSLFTHGSSAQRDYWLRTGYLSGRPGACDTFGSG